MVIDYMIEYISTANSKISLTVLECIYFTILIPYLLARLSYLHSRASYNQSKNIFIGKTGSTITSSNILAKHSGGDMYHP